METSKNSLLEGKGISQIFTPNYIAEFMVNNCLKYLYKDCSKKDSDRRDIKILEPSVGKGVFLKLLLKHGLKNIVAYEIDTRLSKYLKKRFPNVDLRFKNVLGSDIKEKYDLIIGNPPYLGQNYNAEIFQQYTATYSICKKYFVGNMDLLYFFIHLGIEKLKTGGILCFITTDYWIKKSKNTGIKLLKPHILKECFLLEYFDLSNLTIFNNAKGQHNCIFVLQKRSLEEKEQKSDKPIKVIQIKKKDKPYLSDENFNKWIFDSLIRDKKSKYILKYDSALKNNDLKENTVWNLTYPKEVKGVIDKIEKKCHKKGKLFLLKDLFVVRNGLIFIKDEIFILKEGENLLKRDDEFFIKINDKFVILSKIEKTRLKKLYKSKSIKPFGYDKNEYEGYAIFFNKVDFDETSIEKRNFYYKKKYPLLTSYVDQYKSELEGILNNAKENPKDIYFPRRGAHVKRILGNKQNELTDLEPLYEKGNKIFIRYITDENVFGYSKEPYFATSDTYFLWPRILESEINYTLALAYLNSKLIHFIFKAKNITIKRSKSKLEQQLPFLNTSKFQFDEQKLILKLINSLGLILRNNSIKEEIQNQLEQQIFKILDSIYNRKPNFNFNIHEIRTWLIKKDYEKIKQFNDALFFILFDIEEERIDYLLSKYYS